MRVVEIVARNLLGTMFTIFGLNGFLNFIHQPPPPEPVGSAILHRDLCDSFLSSLLRRPTRSWIASAIWILRTVGARPLGC